MNKELEALEKIKQARYFIDFELDVKVGEDYTKELDIIETALEDYEILKKLLSEYIFIIENMCVDRKKDIGDLHERWSAGFNFHPMLNDEKCIRLWNIRADYISNKKKYEEILRR